MSRLIAWLLALFGRAAPLPAAPLVLRTDLLYGYFLTFDDQARETAEHVNFVHEGGWFGVENTIASMKAHGKPVLLDLSNTVYASGTPAAPYPNADSALRSLFNALQKAGVLSQVFALYPVDEPDLRKMDAATVTSVNAMIRRVCADYGLSLPLWVIYTPWRLLPGFDSYDVIGMDDYPRGADVLTGDPWMEIMARLASHQRALLVPGGGDPWRQDPEAFRRYAHSTPQVIGIMPFMWSKQYGGPDPAAAPLGIRDNGMASVYRALGRELAART